MQPGDKRALPAEPTEARAPRHVRACFTRTSVGNLVPKDLAASRPARATVNRRRARPVTWVQQCKAGVLLSVESFSDCSASPAHPLQASDWTGSVALCVQTATLFGSAFPTSVPRQARGMRSWSAVAPSRQDSARTLSGGLRLVIGTADRLLSPSWPMVSSRARHRSPVASEPQRSSPGQAGNRPPLTLHSPRSPA